ncbi:MAG: phosphotransferase family protein [Ilumatobacteraceae bacterium]
MSAAHQNGPVGIDVGPISTWFVEHIAGAVAPLSFEVIAGGHSNLTLAVTGVDGYRFVMRRPPLGPLLPRAHDMQREHRIISALRDTPVPVAPALGYCDDPAVSDAPFYVMGFVDGHVVRDRATAERVLSVDQRRRAADSLVDTLVAIHAVDVEAVGLADLGRHDGYIARQLRRWYGQWNSQHTDDLAAIHRVHDRLVERIPPQGPATIVHGDYRLDNTMVADDGTVIAVLDWEICTLGDPLADLGLLCVYWTGPGDAESAWGSGPTTAAGFPDRAGIVERYAARSGRDVSLLDYYVAFANWKLACIIEGVLFRYRAGALGERDAAELTAFRTQVEAAASRAEQLLETM